MKGVKVFNICTSYRYQSIGYYVSLLAEARGNKTIPSTTTIQDMKSVGIIRLVSDSLEEMMKKALPNGGTGKLSCNIYFGRTMDKKLEQIGTALFKAFPTPFLKADFSHVV